VKLEEEMISIRDLETLVSKLINEETDIRSKLSPDEGKRLSFWLFRKKTFRGGKSEE